ncbi:glycosyltransferase family 2 protein, partial [Pseudomonas syringae]|nr:glycosyltransferase family 2 protein [Pseudomonas syringae]
MIGILIPVHNEEQLLDACLTTVLHAAANPDLKREGV